MLALIFNSKHFTFQKLSSKLKSFKLFCSYVSVSLSSLISQAMDPSIDNLLALTELRERIFSYLDPDSIKAAALVSR